MKSMFVKGSFALLALAFLSFGGGAMAAGPISVIDVNLDAEAVLQTVTAQVGQTANASVGLTGEVAGKATVTVDATNAVNDIAPTQTAATVAVGAATYQGAGAIVLADQSIAAPITQNATGSLTATKLVGSAEVNVTAGNLINGAGGTQGVK